MSEQLPNVGRPKGGAWRHLQDEGIIWEGQILVTGDETDLAALLIVTNERLAFVRGGSIVLDIDRDWLDPAPVLRRTGTVQLWISPPDDPIAESLTFLARDGRDEAAVLLSLLSGADTFGSAYRLPSYVPEHLPPAPDVPVAPSRRQSGWDEYGPSQSAKPLPVFSLLDDDDFPPVATSSSTTIPAWEEAIAEALEPSTLMPLAGSVRNPNDPLRPIEGFDSKYTRDRRSWVIRLVGLFAVVAIGSIIASGLLPGVNDLRGLIDDEKTPIVIAQVEETPAETPIAIATQNTSAQPTATATRSGPSTSDPRDPTVIPLETAVVLGVGGEETDSPPSATSTSTAEPTEEVLPSPTPTTSTESGGENAGQTSDAIIPAPDENFTPQPTATSAEQPTATPTETTPETTEPAADQPESSSNDSLAGLRLDLKEVHRGERLPDLTLGRNSVGEWVVILVEVANESTTPIELPMNAIQLVVNDDSSQSVSLDSASSAVASYLGMTPTVRSDESALIPAGGVQPLALVFSIPPGLGDVTLIFGDQRFDLSSGAPEETASVAPIVQSLGTTFSYWTSYPLTGSFVAAEPTPASLRTGIRFAGWLTGETSAEPALDPTAESGDVNVW